MCYIECIGGEALHNPTPIMTNAVISQSIVNYYEGMTASQLHDAAYAMAGKIAMEGCTHGRLCVVHSMHAAALANCGPDDSDHDDHREWRSYVKPFTNRLVLIAEQAYQAA